MATEFKIKGLKRWQKALDARGFDEAARINMRRATALNGKVAEALMRKTIQGGNSRYKKNAALTQAIKGSEVPLVDHGDLFQGITSQVIDDFTVFAGVLRTNKNYNVGVTTHEGKMVKVTPAMRGLFFVLWKASEGQLSPDKLSGRAEELFKLMPQGWLPLNKSTEVIVIPPRPWIKIAFRNTQMVKQVRNNWKQALEKTFGERARAGGKS